MKNRKSRKRFEPNRNYFDRINRSIYGAETPVTFPPKPNKKKQQYKKNE